MQRVFRVVLLRLEVFPLIQCKASLIGRATLLQLLRPEVIAHETWVAQVNAHHRDYGQKLEQPDDAAMEDYLSPRIALNL